MPNDQFQAKLSVNSNGIRLPKIGRYSKIILAIIGLIALSGVSGAVGYFLAVILGSKSPNHEIELEFRYRSKPVSEIDASNKQREAFFQELLSPMPTYGGATFRGPNIIIRPIGQTEARRLNRR